MKYPENFYTEEFINNSEISRMEKGQIRRLLKNVEAIQKKAEKNKQRLEETFAELQSINSALEVEVKSYYTIIDNSFERNGILLEEKEEENNVNQSIYDETSMTYETSYHIPETEEELLEEIPEERNSISTPTTPITIVDEEGEDVIEDPFL